jgi:hypothetical protein
MTPRTLAMDQTPPKLSSASELEMTITECYCCQCVVFVLMHWLIVQAQQYYLSGKILHQSCSDFYEFWTENYMIIQIDSPSSQKGKQKNLSHTVRRYTQDRICMDYSLLGPRATSHMRVHLCGGRASAFLSRKLAHALSICNCKAAGRPTGPQYAWGTEHVGQSLPSSIMRCRPWLVASDVICLDDAQPWALVMAHDPTKPKEWDPVYEDRIEEDRPACLIVWPMSHGLPRGHVPV